MFALCPKMLGTTLASMRTNMFWLMFEMSQMTRGRDWLVSWGELKIGALLKMFTRNEHI